MELLLILTYTAICISIFKIFKIPLTKWTVPTAGLGGVVLIATLFIFMNYNHPYSEFTREYFASTPILPAVRGKVISVNAKPNVPLKAGDVLFQIDPEPFQYKVDALVAQLGSAQLDLDRALLLMKKQVGKQRDVDVTQKRVDDLSAQLKNAKFELDETTVRAYSDGYVTQMFIYPGLYVVPVPLKPSMVFVQSGTFTYTGWYRQNSLLRLKKGSAAEIAFDGLPGQVFSAEVVKVLNVMAEGELQASGKLYDMYSQLNPGRIPVILKITDPEFAEFADLVPGGAYGQSAIYSEHAHHLAVLRKILLRMASWLNYLFPFH
ncbi:MAG: biotin/lipoyl-binding protein [gamma proteobacterium symbiont of Taylorina sp.]|nr:biotin/lipoyl-binding protein [gamma proteobacterium symbiont of Taylorina sp.]